MAGQEFADKLRSMIKGPVHVNEPLSRHTTWKIGGPADLLVVPANQDDVRVCLELSHQWEIPWTVLGNGSNVLVAERGIRGLIIKMAKGIKHSIFNGTEVICGAGTLLPSLAIEAARQHLSGLEFAAGIPATVGGAIVMNAGAQGRSMSDLVTKVAYLTDGGTLETAARQDLNYGYRTCSLIGKNVVVVEVSMSLVAGDPALINALTNEYLLKRKQTQPLEFPTAGSVFLNSPDASAGSLIERAGLKGLRKGGAQVSEKHGNFIINRGGATSTEVLHLIREIQRRVEDQFGICLETEIRVLGEAP
ncbi:MAG: UDP-N-acetylmuramate dehydrogenase [Bacillota bacterium]